MSRIKFGNTWWGTQWLNALTHIDYENRLPRGVSYARNGSVKSISIKGNVVGAKVQGSRPRPYAITIKIPKFKKNDEEKITGLILGNTLFLSSLMNRELPTELHEEFLKKKVRLFPNQWSDIEAECSCPDWAVPCKHIAAVIYLIANEIDKNPFLVFQLHDFDIFKSIEKSGLTKEEASKTYIYSIEDIIKTSDNNKPARLDLKTAESIDFSIIPKVDDQILSLLSETSLFYPQGNFKKFMERMYKDAREATKLLAIPDQETTFERDTEEYVNFKALLDSELKTKHFTLATKDGRYSINGTAKFENIINFLKSISISHAAYTSDHVIALSLWYRFSICLMEQGAFVPQLISIDQEACKIRWIPALLNESVKAVFDKMVSITPQDMLPLEFSHSAHYPSKHEQGLLIASKFLGHIIKNAAASHHNELSDPIIQLFFMEGTFSNYAFETKEIPQTINLWLSKFFIVHKDIAPLLKVEAEDNVFTVELLGESKENLAAPIPLYTILRDVQYRAYRADLMRDLSILKEQFPEIGALIQKEGREKLVFDSKKFVEVLFKALPSIKLLGIRILLPKELQEIIKPKLTVALKKKSKSDSIKSYLSLQNLLSFDWQIALGDKFVNVEEFKRLMASAHGIIKFKDQYVYIDESDMQKLIKNLEREPSLSSYDILKLALGEEYNSTPINISMETLELIKSLLNIDKIPMPEALHANIRHYQERGFWWLYKNARVGFGSLIADDMGLGKTLQVIALIAMLKQEGALKKAPGIVIVPTTLLTNWQREIEKFAPSLKAVIYHGVGRRFKNTGYDLLLTTYGTARRELERFKKADWSFIVIDEAQNIKNAETSQTKAIKSIRAPIKIAMTGTPVENRLSEYWSIAEFLNKGYFGNLKTFIDEFAEPIEINRDHRALERFRKITSPFILRRVKTDKTIIKDLPDKNEIDQYCTLTKEQASLYQTAVNSIMDDIEPKEGIERRGLVFKLMTALKQICNHPAHYLKKKQADPEFSGKMALLFELLQTIYENDEKALLFTQYTEMGKLLQAALENRFKSETLFLHGGTTRKGRDEIVDRFQNERQLNILILSLKAGGTGLNLTSATNVIHFDLWWNPAVEAQATDRAYRIGQTKNVMVYRLITKNTFEEKINQMLKEKKELADLAVLKGEKWIGEMSNKDLKNLFAMEK